jgi:hypothetical protein
MPRTFPDRLRQLIRAQRGLLRRDQAAAHLPSLDTLRWLLRSGRWRIVLPSVYATFTGDLAERQRNIAAQLYAGTGAHLAGTTALTIYGFRYAPADAYVHVLVPHGCHLTSREFVRIHRTRRPDPRARAMPPLLVSGPARAVADAARWSYSERAVRAMVAEAVQRGLVTVPALEAELRAGKINGSRPLRLALRDVDAGVRSAPEGDLRSALRPSKVLPEIRWNPALIGTDGAHLPTPDGWLADGGIALEMDSREYHLSPEDWQRTLDRGNRLAGEGEPRQGVPEGVIAPSGTP